MRTALAVSLAFEERTSTAAAVSVTPLVVSAAVSVAYNRISCEEAARTSPTTVAQVGETDVVASVVVGQGAKLRRSSRTPTKRWL